MADTQGLSIRAALEKADETLSSATPEPVAVETTSTAAPAAEPVTTTETPSAAQRARDEAGRFATRPKETTQQPAPAAQTAAQAPTPKPTAEAAPTATQAPLHAEVTKAPQSWTPAAREAWASLPPAARDQVIKREREVTVAMQESAEARRFAHQFQERMRPYEAFIRAENSDALTATDNMMRTAVALRTAPPPQKAQVIAQIVKQFLGTDQQAIELLATALEGAPQPQQQQHQPAPVDIEAVVNRTIQARLQAVHQQKAVGEVESFGQTHEFFEDVRPDMALFMDAATKAGRPMSLDDAYNHAIALHPEISQVMQQRQAAPNAATAQQAAQRAMAAASSVRSTPASSPTSGAAPKSIRGALEAAFEQHTGRV